MFAHLSARREHLYKALGPGRVALVSNPKASVRNDSVQYPYRPGSDAWFLTEFPEPETIAIFTPGQACKYTLFVPARTLQKEVYTGPKPGPHEAINQYGADQAFPLTEFVARLPSFLQGMEEVCLLLGERPDVEALVLDALAQLRKNERSGGRAPKSLHDLRLFLHEQRLYKDEHALQCLREAARLTHLAHLRVMTEAHAGMTEAQVGALAESVFSFQGGTAGYETIVGAGSNATILHYTHGRSHLQAGDLLLVDAGCEWHGWTADVTRTFPIPAKRGRPGTFSPGQRRLYQWVLDAQLAGIAAARAGTTLDSIHAICTRVLVEGLVDVGLLQGKPEALIAQRAHTRYVLHGTSHWLGLDVHDVGAYYPNNQPRVLADGMVFTIEPGLYIPNEPSLPAEYRGLGIRIEDDILIDSKCSTGNEILTRHIPKTIKELEQL